MSIPLLLSVSAFGLGEPYALLRLDRVLDLQIKVHQQQDGKIQDPIDTWTYVPLHIMQVGIQCRDDGIVHHVEQDCWPKAPRQQTNPIIQEAHVEECKVRCHHKNSDVLVRGVLKQQCARRQNIYSSIRGAACAIVSKRKTEKRNYSRI